MKKNGWDLLFFGVRISTVVITKARKYAEIKAQLSASDKIWVMSCNSCVRFIGTGGEEKMREMVQKLKKDGYRVLGTTLIGAACVKELVREKVEPDTVVMLSCDAGIFNINQILKPKKIVPALHTLGIGVRDMKGNYTLVKQFK